MTNRGPGAAGSAALDETLPKGLEVVGVSPSAACNWSVVTVHCDLGTIASGANRTVTVDVRVVVGGARLVSRATASSANHDPVSANNSASLEVRTTGARGK